MKKYFKRQLGQSLLEMIFAIGILLMVLSAVLALSSSNIAGEKESESQITANNLAREGIEVARNIRDTNWLNKYDWDIGLVPVPGSPKARPRFYFDLSANAWKWEINFPIDQANPSFLVYLFNTPPNVGIFNYDAAGVPTGFYRYLLINYLCQQSDGSEYFRTDAAGCPINETKIGLQVKSVVSWQESGKARQVAIEDYLYAWK